MIGFVAFSLKRASQGFWRNALMSIAATATMVLMLVLLAGFWILQTGLLSALDFTEQKVEVTANVRVDATPGDIVALPSTGGHHKSRPTRRAFTNVWRTKTSTAHRDAAN